MKKYLFLLLLSTSLDGWADKPVFSVTPNLMGQTALVQGQQGSYIYQITNNTNNSLSNIGLVNLPVGVTAVSATTASGSCASVPSSCQYCSFPLTLASQSSCLIKLNVDSSQISSTVQGGPQVCFSASRPVYCSQPFQANQLSTQILPGPISSVCNDNISNFNYELSLAFDDTAGYDPDWGPARASFPLSTSNPDLSSCASSVSWKQARIIYAADLWIQQKLNYCEHHVPDFQTPIAKRGNVYGDGGYCNPVIDYAPGTVYYNQQARWNYSGSGFETANNWVNNGAMWYGFDCSNYTAFLYDFALNISFSAGIQEQAGQTDATSSAGPNNGGAYTTVGTTSGPLVCVDGTTTCSAGNYISTINSSGVYSSTSVTIPLLTSALHPGDLIYIAGSLSDHTHTPAVTHVILWTGKMIGTGQNDIAPSRIAPDELCLKSWQPQTGQPVITDSHYQGPDYRMLTQCFYLENVWAVRRPI